MARINLLPWREARRQEQQRTFLGILAGAVILTGLVVFAVDSYFQGQIDYQNRRNSFINAQIKAVDKQIKEIESLKKTKQELIARMNVIGDLQSSRPGIVHFVEELASTIPEGVYITSMIQRDKKVSIKARADSNAMITEYMRRIDLSEWLDKPELGQISVSGSGAGRTSSFDLNAEQTSPEKQPDESES